jgi:hypothetical protein
MELVKFTQCTRNLDFEPTSQLRNNLTPIAFSGELLNGFKHPESAVVLNYLASDTSLLDLLKSIYEDLSYIEVLCFSLCLERNPQLLGENSIEDFFSAFHLRLDENLKQTNRLVAQLPRHFLNWCAEKKWGPQDFSPLRSLTEGIIVLTPYLELLNSPLSKNDGTLIFELLIELLMMGKDLKPLLLQPTIQWLPILKKERYPLATFQSQKKEEQLRKFSWPLHSQVKWVRKGDKSGVELKLFITHPQDLERSLIKLEQLKGKDLWSID